MSSGAEGIGPWRYYYESRKLVLVLKYLGFVTLLICVAWIEGVAEKIENITKKYGYWSTTELWKFDNVAGNSTRVPFDAHELVSLVAPVGTSFRSFIPWVLTRHGSEQFFGTKAKRTGG